MIPTGHMRISTNRHPRTDQPFYIVMIFASVMVIPLLFYIVMAAWIPRTTLQRAQFLLGLTVFVICGPFINLGVSLYACWYMDNFGWGKTRRVVSEAARADDDSGERFFACAPDLENQLGGLGSQNSA
jgi:hypothetical protein